MKKGALYILALAFTLSLFYSFTLPVQAKKKIVRGVASSRSVTSSKPIIRPSIRADRKALSVNFSNLQTASSVSYELTYDSNGVTQGVIGTITPNGQIAATRELLFGTCSKNVCTYHANITGMKYVVTSTLTSGTKIRKTFRIKP